MYAAGALIINSDGKFCLFKKHKENGISLPMGKADVKDFSFLSTASREVFEETGIKFELITKKYFIRHDGNMLCIVYLGREISRSESDNKEGLVVITEDPTELLNGPYPVFNKDVLEFFKNEIKNEKEKIKNKKRKDVVSKM